MHCPNCSSEVLPGPTCPRCGSPLEALPSARPLSANAVYGTSALVQARDAGPGSVPLTAIQQARLIVECVPLLFFVLAFVFSVTVLDDIVGAPPPTALLLFLGFVILVVGWSAIQRMRDLTSGVALVQSDLLKRSWHARRGSRRYGDFEQLGTLRLTRKAYYPGQPGRRYRVFYSPASKIVWALEPLS